MDEISQMLDTLSTQENDLVFTSFSAYTARDIGLQLIEEAEKRNITHIAIDITRGDQQLFHFSFDCASADNDEWIKRKRRIVRRFGHSSYYMYWFLEKRGNSFTQVYHLSEKKYCAHGGSFPIIIAQVGIIGSITVSGLPHADDHQLIVDVLKTYLKK